jgi:class 3 adenylate cyclase
MIPVTIERADAFAPATVTELAGPFSVYGGAIAYLAARLCAEAKNGQILISSRVAGSVESVARLEDLGNLELRGLRRPVAAFNVTAPVTDVPVRL